MLNHEQETLRVPPHPAGTIQVLRAKGHDVTVRRDRNGSLRYRIDAGRELNALQMSALYARRYEVE